MLTVDASILALTLAVVCAVFPDGNTLTALPTWIALTRIHYSCVKYQQITTQVLALDRVSSKTVCLCSEFYSP